MSQLLSLTLATAAAVRKAPAFEAAPTPRIPPDSILQAAFAQLMSKHSACRKLYFLCHTVSVNSHEIHAPSLAAARRSAAVGSGS